MKRSRSCPPNERKSYSVDTMPDAGNQIGSSHTFRAKRLSVRMSISASQKEGIE